VCLAREKAKVSSEDADTFASLLLSDLWTAAQERGKRKGIKPFYVYVDEFQRFVTPTIAENLDEARGFGLHLTLAHQFPKQLQNEGTSGQKLYDSVMENTTTKVVFRLTHEDNLRPMAEWLFRGTMDPDQIKQILYSTKVMGYRREWLRAESMTTTDTSGSSTYAGISAGQGTSAVMGTSAATDDLEHVVESAAQGAGDFSGDSSGETESWSKSQSASQGQHEAIVPILGKEIAHIERRSLEEQVFRAMGVLYGQHRQQFLVRIGDRMMAPIALEVPTVNEGLAQPARVERYTRGRQAKWPFYLSFADARSRLEERERRLLEQLRHGSAEEPPTSRRRIQ
jgi:hypothetical protein